MNPHLIFIEYEHVEPGELESPSEWCARWPLVYYNSNSLNTSTKGTSNLECLLHFLASKGMRWHFTSHFCNEVIRVEFDYFFLFIVFWWLLFFLATSRWLYGVPWIDTHLFGATKCMKLIHFCPGQCGNLGRCDSVPQVRRVADEGSPAPCPHQHLCPPCLDFWGPPVAWECVRKGVVPWNSQMMEQSDTKSGACGRQSFWVVSRQCAGYVDSRASPGGQGKDE